MEKILVIKQNGNKLKLKVSKRNKNRYANPQYKKTLNPNDANDLALFMGDLKLNFNSPIDKAFKILKKDEEDLGKGFFLWEKEK